MNPSDGQPAPPWWRALTPRERGSAALAALGAFGLLLLGLCLTPDPRGLGTHEQLGLPPCTAQWLLGVPCPFCGMTTAFSLVSRGSLVAGFLAQPAGALLALACAGAGLAAVAGAVTGRWPARTPRFAQRRWAVAAGGFILAAAWLYKLAVLLLH
jgi:Protein of unknown function (DUF2752)